MLHGIRSTAQSVTKGKADPEHQCHEDLHLSVKLQR